MREIGEEGWKKKVDSSESGEMKLELSPIGRVSVQAEMDDVLNDNRPDLDFWSISTFDA